MSTRKTTFFYAMLLAVASLAVGMVIASRLDLTPSSSAQTIAVPPMNSAPLTGAIDAQTFRNIAKSQSPMVVNIRTEMKAKGQDLTDFFGGGGGGSSPDDFLPLFGPGRQGGEDQGGGGGEQQRRRPGGNRPPRRPGPASSSAGRKSHRCFPSSRTPSRFASHCSAKTSIGSTQGRHRDLLANLVSSLKSPAAAEVSAIRRRWPPGTG